MAVLESIRRILSGLLRKMAYTLCFLMYDKRRGRWGTVDLGAQWTIPIYIF